MSFRYLTEVTKDNIPYCKELIELAEVRHLDKIKGNFSIFDDRIYLANAVLKEAQSVSQLIYSNVRTIVEQQEYLFARSMILRIPSPSPFTSRGSSSLRIRIFIQGGDKNNP